MSTLIQCDCCKDLKYADSRSNEGDYHEIWIDRSYSYHLCRKCYASFMKDTLHLVWDDENMEWV